MSDEFKNINDTGSEPEKGMEHSNDGSYTQGDSFVMRSSEENEKKTEESRETSQEPQEAPSEENPYYAHTYRKASEPRQESGTSFTEKSTAGPEKEKKDTERNKYSSYQFASPIPPEKNEKKKKGNGSGTVRKLGFAAACAAVFGLVAGVVFQGVNYVGGRLMPEETTQIAQAQLANTDSSNASSDNGSSGQGTVSQVAANVMPSIVAITSVSVQEIPNYYGYFFGFGGEGQTQEQESSGSGIIVGQNDSELLIATNNHVVEGASSLSVGFIDKESVEGEVKGTDVKNDLAVVSVKLSDIPKDTMNQIKIATVGDSDELQLGDQVVAIGNALGYGQSVTSGYVSALDRDLTLTDQNGTTINSTGLIQTDAAINEGNSGGALLNMNGELIGINEAKTASSSTGTAVDNIGFAIPIDKAETSLKQLMNLTTREKVDESQASYLGIEGQDVSEEATELYGIPSGVVVAEVVENGPADEAGVKKGDILTELDGRSISNMEQLHEVLEYYAAGEKVDLVVQRADNGAYQEQTLSITLGSAADAQNE